jgi:hypothetical protein
MFSQSQGFGLTLARPNQLSHYLTPWYAAATSDKMINIPPIVWLKKSKHNGNTHGQGQCIGEIS